MESLFRYFGRVLGRILCGRSSLCILSMFENPGVFMHLIDRMCKTPLVFERRKARKFGPTERNLPFHRRVADNHSWPIRTSNDRGYICRVDDKYQCWMIPINDPWSNLMYCCIGIYCVSASESRGFLLQPLGCSCIGILCILPSWSNVFLHGNLL